LSKLLVIYVVGDEVKKITVISRNLALEIN